MQMPPLSVFLCELSPNLPGSISRLTWVNIMLNMSESSIHAFICCVVTDVDDEHLTHAYAVV